MRKILPILLALAMVLTLLPVSAFAVGTDRTEDLAALEEQMRQELFSADDRIYAEDYEAPEAPDPDEIIRVLVETRLRLLWRLPPRKAPPTCRLLKLQP